MSHIYAFWVRKCIKMTAVIRFLVATVKPLCLSCRQLHHFFRAITNYKNVSWGSSSMSRNPFSGGLLFAGYGGKSSWIKAFLDNVFFFCKDKGQIKKICAFWKPYSPSTVYVGSITVTWCATQPEWCFKGQRSQWGGNSETIDEACQRNSWDNNGEARWNWFQAEKCCYELKISECGVKIFHFYWNTLCVEFKQPEKPQTFSKFQIIRWTIFKVEYTNALFMIL